MPAPFLRSRAQPGHVLVDEPNLPAQRVDAVAPPVALELSLLKRGALRGDLAHAGFQLAAQRARSPIRFIGRALKVG